MAWNFPWGVGPEDIDRYYSDDPEDADDEDDEEEDDE